MTPIASEHLRMHGWTILQTFEHEARHDFIAVHDVTGETRDIDITGYAMPAARDLERMILMGFPTRGDCGFPHNARTIDALWARFRVGHPDIAARARLSPPAAPIDNHMRHGRFARLWA